MKVGIDVKVCRKMNCEKLRLNGRCSYLLHKCQTAHIGCIIPKECSYKNLHILRDVKLYRESCKECPYK